MTVALHANSPLSTAGSKLAKVMLLWKTPLAILYTLERVTSEEFVSGPLGPNQVVNTDSLLDTDDGRVTVHRRITTLSLRKRPLLMVTSTCDSGAVKIMLKEVKSIYRALINNAMHDYFIILSFFDFT